ncbi:hypothetical protein F-liban_13 [Faustovirus]|nr:hypothetical protein F-liban_13 [Faustovirus]SME64677.1 Hypothetical protein FSTVST1_12 [Faustovirus ST1]
MSQIVNSTQPTQYSPGQTLIDYATGVITTVKSVVELMKQSEHKHHRMAVYGAIMCDNINAIKAIIPLSNLDNMCVDTQNQIPALECCLLASNAQPTPALPDILKVDATSSITMICVEYDAIACFKYLHSFTNEEFNDIINKAIKYGAQKILTFLASRPELTERIIDEAKKYGLGIRIYPL